MTAPLISVLMTAFNREQYIGAAIESVLAQSVTNFELVVVDDSSRDGTVDVARRYASRDPRVRVVCNQRNLGDYPNRNHAASLAKGRLFKFHDSDDLMYEHCLAMLLDALERYPEAGFALSSSSYWHGGPCPLLSTPRLSYEREFLGYGMFMCGPASAMFRTDVFRSLGGFDDVGTVSDHAFWLKACARVPVVLVSADLFWYRVHHGQELQSDRAERDALAMSRRAWSALSSAECPLDPRAREIARRNHTSLVARDAWRDLRRGRAGLAWRRVRTAGLAAHEWMRYLRRPRRLAVAGTPLDERGEYVLPRQRAQVHDSVAAR